MSHKRNYSWLLRSLGSPSRFFLSSESARSRGSSNLLIQRSAISLIGTGLMKCSFSRPFRFQETRLASLRIARCFATAWRVISSPWHSSPSVWPFLRCSRSSNRRRLPSAKARNTTSSSIPEYGTVWLPNHMEPIGCLSSKKLAPSRRRYAADFHEPSPLATGSFVFDPEFSARLTAGGIGMALMYVTRFGDFLYRHQHGDPDPWSARPGRRMVCGD